VRFPKPIRLAPEAYANPDNVFHLVLRTHPEVGDLPLRVRETVWESVLEQRDGNRIVLVAACLMRDHLHLVARPGPLSIIQFLDRWKSWSTRLAWSAGHQGPLWQPSAWDRALRNEQEFAAAVEYVLRNPVAAGLVELTEEWPHAWSEGCLRP